ncbi:MAG: carboxylesterase family protein [Acidobacteriaceae bacterium]|nr:carboxylesterase family protein [Acidobacteriaceae bacterium]
MGKFLRWSGCLFLLLGCCGLRGYAQEAPVVRTSSGMVQGIQGAGSMSFLGIPFAAPPVGELRWQAPRPPARWDGVRLAQSSGPACPAQINGDGPRSEAEDCLYLNVYTPEHVGKDAKLPVMIFFHGGANLWGSTSIYDGMRMAEVTHAVVVMPSYRLGILGLLDVPGMGDDAGDFMLEDQLAALRWVQANVAAFGGDPNDVTVSGQSAGSMDVCDVLASPAAHGLFRQAILQSGTCQHGLSQKEARLEGEAYAEKLGCSRESPLACLRAKPVGELIDGWPGDLRGMRAPASGGSLLPEAAEEAIAAGHFLHVPLLIGFTRDELWPFQHALYPLSESGLQAQFAQRFGAKAVEAETLYPESAYPHREYALGAAAGDQWMICGSLQEADEAAKWTRVSVYEFADRTAPPFRSRGAAMKRPEGYWPGAFHTAELQYLYAYQSAEGPLSASQRRFGDQMMRLWVGFGRESSSAFPVYRQSQRSVLVLGEQGDSVESSSAVYEAHHCSFWNSPAKPE